MTALPHPGTAPFHLRVMAEFASNGLWTPRTPAGGAWRDVPVRECDPEAFGLSVELRARLTAWIIWFERDILSNPAGEANAATRSAFAREGLSIACAVKRELPHVVVSYFDEALFDEGLPRTCYLDTI